MGRPKGSKNKKGQTKLQTFVCQICGKVFKAYPSYKNEKRKFCSEKCYRISRKGWKPNKETIKKLRIARSGRKPTLGIKPSPNTRKILSQALKGNKSPRWKGGVNPTNDTIRKSVDYKLWREAVLKRDNYTCQMCGLNMKNTKKDLINVHHIKEFAIYPELRFDIKNGITLCKDCHKKIHRRDIAV